MGESDIMALAPVLRKNRSLETLDLSFHGAGLGGAKALGDALARNWTLASLDLGIILSESRRVDGCELGDAGTAHIAKALRENRGLRSLFIGIIPDWVTEGKERTRLATRGRNRSQTCWWKTGCSGFWI